MGGDARPSQKEFKALLRNSPDWKYEARGKKGAFVHKSGKHIWVSNTPKDAQTAALRTERDMLRVERGEEVKGT